jgi:Tfp pilus assembly protein PilP
MNYSFIIHHSPFTVDMLNYVKKATFLLFLLILSGCGAAIRHLDSTWVDDRTVYEKSQPLPPLEIPPALTESQSISQVQSQPVIPLSEKSISQVQSQSMTSPNEELTVKQVQSQPVTSLSESQSISHTQSQPTTSFNGEVILKKENRLTRALKKKVKLKDNSI